jgi:hypothetical protein
MSDAPTTQAAIDTLNDIFSDLKAVIDEADDAFFQTVPEVSHWSPAEHVYHVLGATAMMLKASALLAHGAVNGEPAELSEAGKKAFKEGALPRGVAVAPDKTVPPEALSRDDLNVSFARSRGKLEAAAEALQGGSPSGRGLPHPMFGVLTAQQWLEAARIHCRHHLNIIDDIQSA